MDDVSRHLGGAGSVSWIYTQLDNAVQRFRCFSGLWHNLFLCQTE